jgi:hypothetical protein
LAEDKKAAASPAKKSISIPPLAIVLIALTPVLLAGLWFINQPPAGNAPLGLTQYARQYVRNLSLSGVEMKANESYMKQQVVEITGKIGNRGDRQLKVVTLNCVFSDPYGQVVLRKQVDIVTKKMNGLAPGETKSFRMAFDELPDSWNQALPQLVIASIVFG